MAHELEHAASAVYAGNVPAWHGLGIVLPDAALTVERIIELVPELGSTITPSPVLALNQGDVMMSDKWVANVRDYDGKIVGVVSPTYQLVQPSTLFQFGEDLIDQGGAVWDTALVLRDGAVNVGCLKLPNEVEVAGLDTERHTPYLMVANSFDGSMALTVTISWVRAVCMNTVNYSVYAAKRTFSLRHTESIAQQQVSRSASGDDSFAPAPGQSMRANAVYFDPSPAPFNAFTYCASVLLTPSTSKRVVQGEFRFPAFSATPNVSVQIISSIAGAPMQVHALKIQEVPGILGGTETQIAVEAETIFDVSPGGLYYANLVVTGVPVVPPTKQAPPNS